MILRVLGLLVGASAAVGLPVLFVLGDEPVALAAPVRTQAATRLDASCEGAPAKRAAINAMRLAVARGVERGVPVQAALRIPTPAVRTMLEFMPMDLVAARREGSGCVGTFLVAIPESFAESSSDALSLLGSPSIQQIAQQNRVETNGAAYRFPISYSIAPAGPDRMRFDLSPATGMTAFLSKVTAAGMYAGSIRVAIRRRGSLPDDEVQYAAIREPDMRSSSSELAEADSVARPAAEPAAATSDFWSKVAT